jgi:broad specificity phosphatase PhoE
MIIYSRHSVDQDSAVSTYRDDVQLLKRGRILACLRAKRLVRYFSVPNVIITSPFQRAQDTAKAMVKWMTKHCPGHPVVPIEIDYTLSRLFSREEQEAPSLDPNTTLVSNIPVKESFLQFQQRVCAHTRGQVARGSYSPDQVVWCISHSLVLLEVAELHHKRIRDPVQFLDWFHVRTEPCSDCLVDIESKDPLAPKSSKSKHS